MHLCEKCIQIKSSFDATSYVCSYTQKRIFVVQAMILGKLFYAGE